MGAIESDHQEIFQENESLKDKLAEALVQLEELKEEQASERRSWETDSKAKDESISDLSRQIKKSEGKQKADEKKGLWLWKRIDELKLENEHLKISIEELKVSQNRFKVREENQNSEVGESISLEVDLTEAEALRNEVLQWKQEWQDQLKKIKSIESELLITKDAELNFEIEKTKWEKKFQARLDEIGLLQKQIEAQKWTLEEKNIKIENLEKTNSNLRLEIAQGLVAPRDGTFMGRATMTRANQLAPGDQRKNPSVPEEEEIGAFLGSNTHKAQEIPGNFRNSIAKMRVGGAENNPSNQNFAPANFRQSMGMGMRQSVGFVNSNSFQDVCLMNPS